MIWIIINLLHFTFEYDGKNLAIRSNNYGFEGYGRYTKTLIYFWISAIEQLPYYQLILLLLKITFFVMRAFLY